MKMDNLEQVANGLFTSASTKAITIDPSQLWFGKYMLPGTLGHSEHEEIGARIVEASQEHNHWVGMNYENFSRAVIDEVKGMYDNNEIARKKMERSQKGWFRKAIEYLCGVKDEPQPEEELKELPFSVLATQIFFNPRHGNAILSNEIRSMADKGYLTLVETDEKTYLMPTQKLADTVYASQNDESNLKNQEN